MKTLVFDVETTGLPTKWDPKIKEIECWPHIVQLSWMIYNPNEDLNISDYYIKLKDGMEIPEESTKIHGITNEKMREEGVDIKEILIKLQKDMNECDIIVAHNLKFDKSLVLVESLRNKIGFSIPQKQFCTMLYGEKICDLKRVTKWGKTVSKYPKLIELHQKLFHYEPSNLHNSLYDILVCLRCYYKLRYNQDILTIDASFADFPCFKIQDL